MPNACSPHGTDGPTLMLRQLPGRLDRHSLATLGLVVMAAAVAWALYPRVRAASQADGVTEIVFWTPPGPPYDAAKIVADEFMRRRPEYRVVLGTATTRDATGDPTRFLLGVAGDMPPDVILFDRFAIVEWASRGAFTDLNPYIEKQAGIPHGIREENFFAPAWRESIYQGRNYAIAMDADTRALFYNANSLIRAGFTYRNTDPEVESGRARAGDARPPRTWEEILAKRLHAAGTATADGRVTIDDYRRAPFLNENIAPDARPDLRAAGVQPGDIVVLLKGRSLFRARVAEVTGPRGLRLDMQRELPAGRNAVPSTFASDADIKIFAGDGYIGRLSRFDPETGIITEAGYIPLMGNSWLYLFGWQNGGEFMSDDGRTVTLDDPRIVGAMQWLTDVYDAMGGIEMVNYIQSAMKRGGEVSGVMDPFLAERVAMRVDIDYLLRDVMRLRPDLDFGVAPAPLPQSQLARGVEPFGWGGGWAYAIPSTSRNKDAAWELIEWMASVEANKLLAEYQASLYRSRGQKFIPRLHANRLVMEWQLDRYIDSSPDIPPQIAAAYRQFADLMPTSRFRPVTPVGQKLWTEHVRAADAALNHARTPYEALNYGTRQVQQALDRALNPPDGPVVNWTLLIVLYALAVAALFAGLVWRQERRRRAFGGKHRQWLDGYVCASPWLLGFVVFGAGPILFSIVISFCSYDVINPARFIGFENYNNLMGTQRDPLTGSTVRSDPIFYKSLYNTLYMVLGVPLQIVLGLAIAVLLDTRVRGLTGYRAIYYLPAIVPPVAGFILWVWLFDPARGMINQALLEFGFRSPPKWFDDALWAKPSMIIMGLWGVGASMIIWLAGLKDIPSSLYEAAEVDGASWLQRFSRITIPLLTPYILFNLIIGLIAVFQIFEPAYIMTDGGPADSTYFFAYKLFHEAFRFLDMGAASAMAWILFVVVLAITLAQLWLSRKWVHYGS